MMTLTDLILALITILLSISLLPGDEMVKLWLEVCVVIEILFSSDDQSIPLTLSLSVKSDAHKIVYVL